MSKWEYFSVEEMMCPCGCGKADMNDSFMYKLVRVREELGKPMVVTSGYRCEEYNEKIGGVKNSAHTKGRAADISITGMEEVDQVRLLEYAIHFNIRGLGINDKKSHFIHLDDTRSRLWSY